MLSSGHVEKSSGMYKIANVIWVYLEVDDAVTFRIVVCYLIYIYIYILNLWIQGGRSVTAVQGNMWREFWPPGVQCMSHDFWSRMG